MNKNQCSCCKCITSFCYCLCECGCHQEKIIQKNYTNKIYDDLPHLNIDELRMKSLKEYESSTIMDNTKKTLGSSRSMINFENTRMNCFDGINQNFINERNQNKFEYLENNYLNKSQEINYTNNSKKTKKNRINNIYNDKISNNNNTLTNYYKTQTNFNILKKYYQLNRNKNDKEINKTLKSQLEFNKLLSTINNDEIIIKKKNLTTPKTVYNTYIYRENNFHSKKNNHEIDSDKIKNISDNISNNEKKNIDSKNFQIENYREENNKNSIDLAFNTEYNKPFRPFIFNNKSLNLNEEFIDIRTDNKKLTLDKYNDWSKSNNESELNSYNNFQNEEDNQFSIENNDYKLYNNRYINKIKSEKFSSNLQLKVYNSNNSNNIDPLDLNLDIDQEKKNQNPNSNFSRTSNNNQIEKNRNEFLESKDINLDNFIITFGAKGNNEVKNIITSLKNEFKSQKNKKKDNDHSDNTIDNIINDYEKLKKKYEPNRLFTGIQNNINNFNGKINYIKENSIKGRLPNFSISKFDLNFKGELNKNINGINGLKKELKEAKNKIEELTIMVKNYQKEISLLRGQITKSKGDSMNNSKINTINDISTSNNNSYSNKTKIGKNSFIIKIPESLIKRRMNRDKQSRNNSLNDMTNIRINNQDNNENNTLLDLTNNTYKKVLLKNNSSNFNNINISNISNNTNSNYLANININSNISNYKSSNEIYTKKLTTTMKKKFRKSASQKMKFTKINHNIYTKPKDSKRISKLIYTIITKNDNIKLVSFDMKKHKFNEINFIDSDNFEFDFKESFYNNKENNNNIYLNNENNNDFYIVTGRNFDKLYKYNNETNKLKKLCTFKNNHSNGSLLYINNQIICLSGNHNKKVEIFSEQNNSLINLPEMNIERSSFSCCLFKNDYIFALFGYNSPTKQYLDTIEFFDLSELDNLMYNFININDDEWRYLKYKHNNSLNLCVKGHICFNYFDEKIIFFGGFNGYTNEAIDCFYQLNISENFNFEGDNGECYVEQSDKKLIDISKNRIYYFSNTNGLLFNYNQNNMFFEAIDTNYYAHILDLNNFKHNIHYFH